jgi:PKHD-type hydroxylase|tara:strand:+ start:2989 stop:3555 length:567 start_codon:yes stop_codon:yes gene_type:complete
MFTNIDHVFHCEKLFSKELCDKIIETGETSEFKDATLHESKETDRRSSKVSFLKQNKAFEESISRVVLGVNKEKKWNFKLKQFEPFQYSIYNKGDHYNWHVDNHSTPYDDGQVRKISFSILLNDEYEGGDFELSVPCPISEKTQYHKISKAEVGTMIVFTSHTWHKVHPVISGVRKSLVGWTLGPSYV